ncbi:hypothetical protein [Conexibacter woesei]|uniref:Uncharacterized protein n=1 Tax=Conexibacter woesei (strain DSM 14684 / CCUG 47730 / CIP 108061 / JCM 11494 / NBRC 100937 / ID131577) TaxID=469383 RepID=D3F4M0_CONWI|nr:hypothetical protein [Conexibacter woesei]ADB52477.1 hypothetical protein Cwoe_4062 [Conexibacter woesei DSM 14684]
MSESTPAAEWQAQLRRGVELLRPHPHRGDLIAAGAVPLTVALLLVNLRLDDSWGTGIFLVLTALACGLVLGMGVLAPLEEERPRAYQVVLQLCGLVLLFVALLRLAKVLGSGDPLDSAGASFWILAVVAGTAAWLARARRSSICTLVAGIAGIFATLAFVDWVFSPDGPGTSRWILLLLSLGLVVGALLLRDRHRRESVYLVDAAGFAILALGFTFLGTLLFGVTLLGEPPAFVGPGAGWKLVLLAAGLGLVAYSGVDREPGPGYLGTLILLVFVVLVGNPGEGGPSLWFWPLVLLAIGAAMIAAGLRPRQPLPPEPAAPAAPIVPVGGGPVAPAGPASAPPAAVPAPAASSSAARPVATPPAPAPPAPAPPAAAPPAAAPSPPAAAPDPSAPAASTEPAGPSAPPAEPPPPAEAASTEPAGPSAPPAEPPPPAEAASTEPAGPSAPPAEPPPPAEAASTEPAGPSAPPAEPPSPADAAPAEPSGPHEPAPPTGDQPTRPQPPVVPPVDTPPAPAPPRPAEPAPPTRLRPDPRAAPPLPPEPPARGSLWARPDPGEQPTKPHRVPPREPEDDRDV